MAETIALTDLEKITAVVYGDTFALYDEAAFDEFLAPLVRRLEVNGIKRADFEGKRCLDAGCGGGRGSVLMARMGAKEVVGVDLSATNVRSAARRAAQKGFPGLTFQQVSLHELPFPDESFDVVWCNGVLHHAVDPDKGLREITRVLKKGGSLWLYLYGSGGIYWRVVDWVRNVLEGVDVKDCIFQLRLMGTPVRRIAEWIDDWFTPYLRRYTVADVTRRLDELGYERTAALAGGMGYDTSQRRVGAGAEEKVLMGDGDVRHFCRKATAPAGDEHRLPDPADGKGSPYEDAAAVTAFDAPLARLSALLKGLEARRGAAAEAYKVMVSAAVHARARALLETDKPFDTADFRRHLDDLAGLMELEGRGEA